ncbi:IucA/IucC family protein [Ectobacillus antri]|jgi:siderophore synthetase component|uniref:IucA/IucC family protein n=1 Tax=Ectobacillus antri TaxID=2486280 RepID=UPI000F59B33A|nr:IucA/IucC family protein [Ectobacillus antri]
MRQTAKQIAANASFQAFMNSYLKELGQEEWYRKDEVHFPCPSGINGEELLYVRLPKQKQELILEVAYRSLVGRHTFSRVFCLADTTWVEQDFYATVVMLIQELHMKQTKHIDGYDTSHCDELLVRFLESYQNMTHYIEKRLGEHKHRVHSFIEAEQSLVYGHWLHPTPKSRQGMASWHHNSYAPELRGTFQLHYFKVHMSLIKEDSALAMSARAIVQQNIMPEIQIREDEIVIPMHPLQAQWLLQQSYVQDAMQKGNILHLGPLGSCYTATSSIRTLYQENSKWMYKFSIPVKVTNSLRTNRLHELKAGVAMARLIQTLQCDTVSFRIIQDPAYLTVNLLGEESGFEVIIRSNPFQQGHDQGIFTIAALVQDPLPGRISNIRKIIESLALQENRSVQEVSRKWLQHYFTCAIEPLLRLYDTHGIALEAHQQNSILDVSRGYPTVYYYRDNQGYYLSRSYQAYLQEKEPSLEPDLFYEDAIIQERFAYYLFVNQVFSVLHRFGVEGLLTEEESVHWLTVSLQELQKDFTGPGKSFLHMLFMQESFPCKANLLTRLYDVDELAADLEQAVYVTIANPFVSRKELHYAHSV